MKNIFAILKQKKAFVLKSGGNSMNPVLLKEDVVYYRRTSYRQCHENDIILAQKGNKAFTHRIIYKKSNFLITKGDNNVLSDGKIYPRQVIGKVYQIKRNDQIFSPENFYLLQSTLYFKEIVKLKRTFKAEKINFVFLKGLPLHLYFEKSHPRRIYADCDILINKEYYDKAQGILIEYGYKKSDHSLSKIHRDFQNHETEISFYKKINNFYVVFDIHLEITPLYNQFGKMNGFYSDVLIQQLTKKSLDSKHRIKIENEIFDILTQEYLIIFLAIHAFRHNFKGVYRLEFLHKIILKGVEWERLTQIIKYFKLQNIVYPTFILLQKYFDTPIPKSFFSKIKPDKVKLKYIMKNILTTNIFGDEPRIKAGVNRFKNLFSLSPNPWWEKIQVFFNPAVIYSIFWVVARKFKWKRFFSFSNP